MTDQDDGHLAAAEHGLRHAPQHEAGDTAPAVGGHRDQVGAGLPGLLEDFLNRLAEAHRVLHGKVGQLMRDPAQIDLRLTASMSSNTEKGFGRKTRAPAARASRWASDEV